MATLPPLLTPEEFSAGTKGKIAANDPRLPALLGGASAAVRRYCGWHVTPVLTETVVLDGPGGSLLQLPSLRVESVDEVVVNGTELDVDGLEWSAKGMIRRRSWPQKFRSVRVTFTHGFDTEDAAGILQIVQQVVANAAASPLGATSEQAGALSASWSQTSPGVAGGLSLLQRDLDVLNLYRLPKGA